MSDPKFQIDNFVITSYPHRAKRTTRAFLRDIAIYVVVSLVLISLPITVLVLNWHVDAMLLGLGCASAFAAVISLALLNRWWMLLEKWVWQLIAMLLPIHMAAFILIHAYSGRQLFYYLLCAIEFAVALDLFGRVSESKA